MTNEGFKSLAVRVGNGVSKEAAIGVSQFWNAVSRAEMAEADNIKFSGTDYAIIYRYAKACAKAAGVIS